MCLSLNGICEFLVCYEPFYHYTDTRSVSFLSISTSIRFDGRVACGSSSSQSGQLEGEMGIVKCIVFVHVSQLH